MGVMIRWFINGSDNVTQMMGCENKKYQMNQIRGMMSGMRVKMCAG